MFTGLVESVGAVAAFETTPTGWSMRVRTAMAPDLQLGESVAVDGVCLTVAEVAADTMRAGRPDRSHPTLVHWNGGGRSTATGRPDGHSSGGIGAGHVYGTSSSTRGSRRGFARIVVQLPSSWPPLLRRVHALIGSVDRGGPARAIRCDDHPFTWISEVVVPARRGPGGGGRVNLVRMVVKYVALALEDSKINGEVRRGGCQGCRRNGPLRYREPWPRCGACAVVVVLR